MFPCHLHINFSVCLTLTKHAQLSLNTSGIFSHSAPPARLPHSLRPHAHHQRRSSLSGCLKQIAESKDLFLYVFYFFFPLQLHSTTFLFFWPARPPHLLAKRNRARMYALHLLCIGSMTWQKAQSQERCHERIFFFPLERAWKQHHSRFTLSFFFVIVKISTLHLNGFYY